MKALLRVVLLALAVFGSYAAFATTHTKSFSGGTLPLPCPRPAPTVTSGSNVDLAWMSGDCRK
jgi:hypothetical protein